MTIKNYELYFKNIVTKLAIFNNDPDVFRYIKQSEAVGDFRASEGASDWKFRLIEPTFTYADELGTATSQNLQGGFIIAKKYSERNNDSAQIIDLIDEIEDLGLWFAVKMSEDSTVYPNENFNGTHTVTDLQFKSAPAPQQPDGFVSRFFTFKISGKKQNCITLQSFILND